MILNYLISDITTSVLYTEVKTIKVTLIFALKSSIAVSQNKTCTIECEHPCLEKPNFLLNQYHHIVKYEHMQYIKSIDISV